MISFVPTLTIDMVIPYKLQNALMYLTYCKPNNDYSKVQGSKGSSPPIYYQMYSTGMLLTNNNMNHWSSEKVPCALTAKYCLTCVDPFV